MTSHGFEHIERSYQAASGRARLLKPALELIGDDMIESTKIQFESGGRRGGGSWARASKEWQFEKLRSGLDPRPLFATHRLFGSLAHKGDPEMVLDIQPLSIRYGSQVPYADTHQFGDPERGIPARPFIHFLPGDIARWGRIIIMYITDPMRARV